MKKLLLIYLCSLLGINAIAQTPVTVTFKPGADVGQDAIVWMLTSGCGIPIADSNYGNMDQFNIEYWTFNGCPGAIRNFIKFTELSIIPTNAIVTSAKIKFYGVPSSVPYPHGNSGYAGSPYNTDNNGWLRRVNSNWEENTITWNNQPAYSTANQISIPASNAQWNWNWADSSTALVAMVQDMISNPSSNYGFMMMLQTEEIYRSLQFASSDNANSALWPELTVTYTTTDCDANFTYTVNSEDPAQINFEANTIVSDWAYSWHINGQNYSGSQVTYTNQSDTPITVCLDVTPAGSEKPCTKCLTINSVTGVNDIVKNSGIASLTLYPNPTDNDWNIKMQSVKKMNAVMKVYDVVGRLLSSKPLQINMGTQNFNVQASGLSSGLYLIEIRDDQNRLLAKVKALKN